MTVRSLSEAPAGAVPVGGSVPVESAASGVVPAGPGGMPFDPPNCQDKNKEGGACHARRAKGTMFCVGHLRKRGEL